MSAAGQMESSLCQCRSSHPGTFDSKGSFVYSGLLFLARVHLSDVYHDRNKPDLSPQTHIRSQSMLLPPAAGVAN